MTADNNPIARYAMQISTLRFNALVDRVVKEVAPIVGECPTSSVVAWELWKTQARAVYVDRQLGDKLQLPRFEDEKLHKILETSFRELYRQELALVRIRAAVLANDLGISIVQAVAMC